MKNIIIILSTLFSLSSCKQFDFFNKNQIAVKFKGQVLAQPLCSEEKLKNIQTLSEINIMRENKVLIVIKTDSLGFFNEKIKISKNLNPYKIKIKGLIGSILIDSDKKNIEYYRISCDHPIDNNQSIIFNKKMDFINLYYYCNTSSIAYP